MQGREVTQNSSFSVVRLAIDERLNQLRLMKLGSTKEITLLQQLGEKIRAFEHLQRRWISGSGILADYYKTYLLEAVTEKEEKFKKFNQEQLITESISSIKEGAEFAIIMAQQMIILLNDEENQKVIDPHFFKQIEQGIKDAKDAANEIYGKVSTMTVEKIFSDPIYSFAYLLGGRFTFARQSLDPIHGTDRLGFCYGYVMDWKNEISETGKYLSQQRSNKNTIKEQQQHDLQVQRGEGYHPLLHLPCKSTREIWQNIDSILSQIDTSSIYLLGYGSKNEGHAMGLRKCSNGEIEFFDPNFGLFVFPNANLFRVWCNELFSRIIKLSDDFNISVRNIGKQSLHSAPSIPAFPVTIIDNKYENITHQNNIQYLTTQVSLPNLKQRIKEINEMNKINIDLDEIQIHQTYDHALIKTKIIMKIADEFKRLDASYFGDNQKKIMALDELTSRIVNAGPSRTLIGIIEEWLASSPKDSTETYESIIKSQRIVGSGKPTSATFIDKLVTHDEINEHCMAAMQTSVIHNILSIVSTIKQIDPNYSSPLYREISDECMKNNINTQDFMNNIKRCMAGPFGLFAKPMKTEDKKILQLYKLIKELKPDDPYSLTQSLLYLRNLYTAFKKELDLKVVAKEQSAPH